MALLPSASSKLDETGAGVAVGDEPIAILSCAPQGPDATVRPTQKTQDTLDEFGHCEGLQFCGHYVELTRNPYLWVKMPTAAAGVILSTDTRKVVGDSVVTFTGTPTDDEEIVVEVVEAVDVGVSGTIRVSRDGGKTWGGNIRLGASTSYLIPTSGITVAFAAGDAAKGSLALCFCRGPRWDGAGLHAAFEALAQNTRKPRLVMVIGDVDEAADLQSVIDEVAAFETVHGKHTVAFVNGRDLTRPVAMQGAPADVDFAAAGDTITRGTGSWVSDGFKVGMRVTVAGTASNNASHTVTVVTATVLTVAASPGIVDEANVDGADITITGVEPKPAWRAAIEAIVGNTPTTQKIAFNVLCGGGRATRRSPVSFDRKRRPAAWAIACRTMAHDVHVSAAQVDLGPLEGWSIVDERGQLVEHDERVDGGLLAMRVACLRTFNEKGGVYCALPLTLDEDNKPLSRLPVVLVGQLACTVAQRAYTEKLNGFVIRKPDGSMTEAEARRIQGYAQSQLESALLTPGREGQRASLATTTLARGIDLVPGAIVPWVVDFKSHGYLEQLPGTVRVS